MLKSQKFLIALSLFCWIIPQSYAGSMPSKKLSQKNATTSEWLAPVEKSEEATEVNSKTSTEVAKSTYLHRGPSPTSEIKVTHPAGIILLIISVVAVFLFPVYMQKFMPAFTTKFQVS